jgi:carboxylate-amine ligase
VLTAQEWAPLAAGLEQRVRALDALVADVHGERRIVADGVVPAHVIEGAEHLEPDLVGLPAPRVRVAVAGLDVIRGPDGAFAVLEDNLRTPSGLMYLSAARRAVAEGIAAVPLEVEGPVLALLGRALRACGNRPIVLTDGPGNSAYWEHAHLAAGMDVPLVELRDLDRAGDRLLAGGEPVDVVYRRTDEDRLTDERGALTRIGRALLEPLRAGTLTCLNALGNGVADDKLVHAYVEDAVRFYLGEEPLLPSVPTYDPQDPRVLEHVLDRLDELVVKPRAGFGGSGVFIGPTSGPAARAAVAAALRAAPGDFIAQETVHFSRHPTVVDGVLAPRHVDLRAFVVFDGERAEALPGGLSRVAFGAGDLVVNSSQGGGAKDTWVLAPDV